LVTGRLNANRFLGGEFDLDYDKAYKAIEKKVAKPLGMTVLDAALGILKLADVKMSFAVRAITMQRGYDPRKFAMVAFGGAGPLHAMAIARELHVPRVIIPPQPGHFSALGMLLTDLRQDFVQTHIQDFSATTVKSLEDSFVKLENEGRQNLAKEGYEINSIQLIRTLDVRYLGQEYTVRVNVPHKLSAAKDIDFIREKFDEMYEVRYGHAAPDQSAQMVNLRVTAIGPVSKPDFESLRDKRIPALSTQKSRDIYFPKVGMLSCPVYQRAELKENFEFIGPAVVEEYASTTVLFPGDKGTLNQYGCLVILNGDGEA
jgi:N-methylhydantoinase A